MKFIASKIHWVGIFLLVAFTSAAAVLYFDTPATPTKKRTSGALTSPVHAAHSGDHANCNHAHAQPAANPEGCSHGGDAGHSGCGASAGTEKADGCCGGKSAPATAVLPPGHPPIEGYSVAPHAHAGCEHASEPAAANAATHP